MGLTLKESVAIATEQIQKEDLSSISSTRADELTSAFGRMLEPMLKLDAAFKGIDIEAPKGSSDEEAIAYAKASNYLAKDAPSVIASLGVEKAFLSMKANKFTAKEQTLVVAIAKLLNDNLVNLSDTVEVDTSLFKIKFGQVTKVKTSFDTDAIRQLAGYDVKLSVTNQTLVDVFSEPSAKIIEKAVNEHVLAGDIPSTVVTSTEVLGLSIQISRKEE